jgi:uncharacterized membrane protein YgcG
VAVFPVVEVISAAAAPRESGDMDGIRVLRHLLTPAWLAHRAFRPADVAAITAAVAASEGSHRGELRIVVEGPLALGPLLGGQSARERALELFGRFRVWDTRENCGILVYVQLVDRCVEIVADRGIAAKLGQGEWETICRGMEAAFKERAYRRGVLEAIEQATRLLVLHFPGRGRKTNELPDRPIVI